MTERVRVASIGLGWWGKELARGARNAGLDLVTGFARNPDSRRQFAEEMGCAAADSLESVLDDPSIEGVLIATSNASHRELVEAAAAAGKHVFVDKPLTLSVEDARACLRAAEDAGVVLQVGFQRRRHPAHRALKRLIEDGSIGDIETLEANHSLPNRIAEGAWRWDAEQSPLGSMTSLGIHQIENFHYLAGPITRVAAMRRPGRSVTIDEAAAMVFEFDSGAMGILLSSFFTPWRIFLAVSGTEGMGVADRDGSQLVFQKAGENQGVEVPLEPVDAVAEQMADFANAIRNGSKPETGGPEGFAVVAVLEAATKSADSGQVEEVERL
jgi:predicted dehydrogenase